MNTIGDIGKKLGFKILVADDEIIEDLGIILNKLSELRGDIPFYREKIDYIWEWLAAMSVDIDSE